MDSDTKQELERILSIEPPFLTPNEVAFLRARRSYLRPEQKAAYASVLEAKPEQKEKPKKK